jgi:predicted DNA-binding ribbon-helix-helix protein
MMRVVRTTITLDDDLAEKLKQLSEKRKLPFRRVLNEMLRRGLTGQTAQKRPAPFKIETFSSALRSGVDPLKLNQLIDDLEADAARGKLGS